jgi:hypothetical protein
MTLPPYQISRISTKRFKSYEDTQADREIGGLISLLSFLERRPKYQLRCFYRFETQIRNISTNVVMIRALVK